MAHEPEKVVTFFADFEYQEKMSSDLWQVEYVVEDDCILLTIDLNCCGDGTNANIGDVGNLVGQICFAWSGK